MVMRAGLFFHGMLSVTLTGLRAVFVNCRIAEILLPFYLAYYFRSLSYIFISRDIQGIS